MGTLRSAFGVPVGWSDHTLGIEVALAAVALGADLLEKHLTLDKTLPGPDHRASLEPQEFAALVRGVRTVEAALGTGVKVPTQSRAGGRPRGPQEPALADLGHPRDRGGPRTSACPAARLGAATLPSRGVAGAQAQPPGPARGPCCARTTWRSAP